MKDSTANKSNNDNGLCPRMPDERNEPFICDICMDKVHGDMYELGGIQVCKKCYYNEVTGNE